MFEVDADTAEMFRERMLEPGYVGPCWCPFGSGTIPVCRDCTPGGWPVDGCECPEAQSVNCEHTLSKLGKPWERAWPLLKVDR